MDMKYMRIPAEFKADPESGSFTMLGAVFGNVDLGGDRIVRGAFRETLAERKVDGRPLKMMFGHRELIGVYDSVKESRQGLYVAGRPLDEVQRGAEAIALLKAKALDEGSIGYTIPEGGADYDERTGVRTLRKIDLHEVSLVPFAMNPRARVLSVAKALELEDEADLYDALRCGDVDDDTLQKVAAAAWPTMGGRGKDELGGKLLDALNRMRRALGA